MDGPILPIVLDQAKDVSKSLNTAVGGTLSDIWHGIVGDRVAHWRIKNAAAQNALLTEELKKRGVSLRADSLPESYAYRWFEKASEEDEPELQALFARLLANAAEGNQAALGRQNIDLIARMTPEAARLLQAIDRVIQLASEDDLDGIFSVGFDAGEIAEIQASAGEASGSIGLDVLKSIGVLEHAFSIEFGEEPLGLMPFGSVEALNRDLGPCLNLMMGNASRTEITSMGMRLLDALFPRKEPTSQRRR